MEPQLQQLFRTFRQNIIQEAKDTKQHYWEAYIVQLAEKAQHINYKHVHPHKFMTFPEPDCKNIVQRLDSLENACYCLSQYALNLCRNPAVDDFNLLKTYTGYYAVNINSVLEDRDLEVLKLMGYKVCANCENSDEFMLDKRSQIIEYLAFELFLCQAYYCRMKTVCQQALGLDFKENIVVALLTQYNLQDIVGFGLQETCQKILQESSKRNPVEAVDTRAGTYEYLDPNATTGNQWKHNTQPNDHASMHLAGHSSQPMKDWQKFNGPTTPRLVDSAEDDDEDLYGGDVDVAEGTVKIPPSAPPGFTSELPSRTAHAHLYENSYINQVEKSSGNARGSINDSASLQNMADSSPRATHSNVYGDDHLNKVKLPGTEPLPRTTHNNIYGDDHLNKVKLPGAEPLPRTTHSDIYGDDYLNNVKLPGAEPSSRLTHSNVYGDDHLNNVKLPGAEPSSRLTHSNVYGDDHLNKVKLPGENRSHSFNSVNKNRSGGTGDSYAQRAAGSINRMQRQSSLSNKHQNTTGLVRSEESNVGSTVAGVKLPSVNVTVTPTPQRQKERSEGILYKSNVDDENPMTGKRQSLKERNRNIDHSNTESSRVGSLKRTHATSHAPSSDTYMHFDAGAKQLSSQVPHGGGTRAVSGKSSPAYESVVGHETARGGSRSQGSQNIPNLYSTESQSSPSSQH